jgi:mannose-6-phosphate isomerase-like protein (cupin superfamily)
MSPVTNVEEDDMDEARYRVVKIDEIPEPAYEKEPHEADWKPVRIHLGIHSFGTNAYIAREPGQLVVGEHSEVEESGTRHEELYFVVKGHATFTVEGQEVDAPAGTFVYVPDPGATRSAVAREAGTTVICFGGTPGEAFEVSSWERKYDPAFAQR